MKYSLWTTIVLRAQHNLINEKILILGEMRVRNWPKWYEPRIALVWITRFASKIDLIRIRKIVKGSIWKKL